MEEETEYAKRGRTWHLGDNSSYPAHVEYDVDLFLTTTSRTMAESADKAQTIFMGEAEKREGKYNAETLAKALGALNQDGLVVLKNVIPVDLIDKLNAWMCEDADRKLSDPTQEYNHGVKCKC